MIREKSKDELGSLATNINYMASELNEMFEKQRQTERLKDELITNVSRDLRTPLTSIMGYLRLVKDHQYKNQEQLDEYVDICTEKRSN
jgi:signal transduction histidine kinase